MIAKKYMIKTGVGISDKYLPSFDKALLEAGVGNYNLVRLSSILPAKCVCVDKIDIPEGSLLPTAYATISSSKERDVISSAIGVGFPENKEFVGVIMEYSAINKAKDETEMIVREMIKEAFEIRGWKLKDIKSVAVSAEVEKEGETVTTFACIAEW